MQKTPIRIVLKSNLSMESNVFVVAICVNQIDIPNAWACVCMCMSEVGGVRSFMVLPEAGKSCSVFVSCVRAKLSERCFGYLAFEPDPLLLLLLLLL